jgi:hypothetical protein
MGDSAMSMMSGPHGDSGPAHCRIPPSRAAVTGAGLQEGPGGLACPPVGFSYADTPLGSARLKSEA